MTDKQKAIIRYHESGVEKEEKSPLERLRFFCQLAMSGDDWVDAGHFFDSLALQVRDKVDVGPWSAGATTDGRAYLESSDFTHDVRLYVDGDFAWPGDKLNYAQGIAGQLNAAPVSAEPDVTQQTLSDVHVAYSRGKADGLSERVDLIRFDYVNADGQPDSKMITHDEMRERYAVAIRHAYGQAQQPVSGADQFRDAAQMIEPSGNASRNAVLEEAAQELMRRRALLSGQNVALNIQDGLAMYDICIDAIRNLMTGDAQPSRNAGELADYPTRGMNLGQRIAHVGGRENAQGYVEFGSPMAVHALIQHVLRDFHRQGRVNLAPDQQDADKVDAALAEMVHAMFRSGNDVPVTRITIDRKQYEAAVNSARKEQE